MPPQINPLTDEEILAVADRPDLLAKFTPEERVRLGRLRAGHSTRRPPDPSKTIDPLTDDELVNYGDHPDVVAKLTNEERVRLGRLRAAGRERTSAADLVVLIPGVGNVAFPKTMTQDEIDAASAKLHREAQGQAQPTMVDRVVRGASDLTRGVGAGVASTVLHGGDLIRRGLGMERVIDHPQHRAVMTPPEGVAGTVGYAAEQIGEFALPVARIGKAMAGAPLLRRVGVDAATGAGVAGVQSGGDVQQMTAAGVLGSAAPVVGATARAAGRTVSRAAAGASEGGVGGAIASVVRTAVPSEPKTMMVQALKPRASNTGFEAALDRALPELKASEKALGKPIAGVDDLLAAVKTAKQRVRAQYDVMAGPQRAAGSTVDLTPVADAMARSVPSKVRLENGAKARAIGKRAALYRKRFSLEEAEQLLKETNAELEAFYSKYPMAQRRALESDPAAATLVAQAKALRDAIYKTLDAPGQGDAARELNRRYGALLELEDTAARRANVAKRQQPEGLSEQIGAVRAAGDMARGTWRVLHGDLTGAADIAAARAGRSTASYLKEQQTTDALIRRAMAAVKARPSAITMPPQRRVAGLLTRGSVITPVPSHSSVQSVPARRTVQRDPRTGQMRRVYTGETE